MEAPNEKRVEFLVHRAAVRIALRAEWPARLLDLRGAILKEFTLLAPTEAQLGKPDYTKMVARAWRLTERHARTVIDGTISL